MSSLLVIGEFSRATHLTVKALRHYHERGLLVPADIDEDSGYRYYDGDQVERALLIRRLRELEMPLADVEAVLDAPSVAERDGAISAHLERMEAELARTRDVVGSLRELLIAAPETLKVAWRSQPATRAFAITAVVARPDVAEWCGAMFPRVYEEVIGAGLAPREPAGALYSGEFFEEGEGEVTVFVPIDDRSARPREIDLITVPARDLGVAEHVGDYAQLDRTYGALARVVAESGVRLDEPIREYYVVSVNDTDDPAEYRTEVCWPVSALPESAR